MRTGWARLALIKAVTILPSEQFIPVTDDGIFRRYRSSYRANGLFRRQLLEPVTPARLPLNALQNLEQVLINATNKINVEPDISSEAVKSIQRLLDFANENNFNGSLPG